MRWLTNSSWVEAECPAERRFILLSSTRQLTYLPTLWAIHSNANSSQHSLLTGYVRVGSNLLMAARVYVHNGRLLNQAGW
jgi:hypothetical protein